MSAYLASYVAIVLCGEVEATVTSYFHELIDESGCDPLVVKLAKGRKGAARSAKVKDIGDAIEMMGHDFRLKFDDEVAKDPGDEGIARLGNAVGVRDKAAHGEPPPITFGELELAAVAATKVLDAVRIALDLPA